MGIADRFFLRVGDKLRHRIDGHGRMHNQNVGGARTEGEEYEVTAWIEWKLFVEAWVHSECRAEREQERVPVGGRPGDGFCAQIASGTGSILDDNRLLEAC